MLRAENTKYRVTDDWIEWRGMTGQVVALPINRQSTEHYTCWASPLERWIKIDDGIRAIRDDELTWIDWIDDAAEAAAAIESALDEFFS